MIEPVPVRYGRRTKEKIINQIRDGTLARVEAMELHNLSAEELDAWFRNYDTYGIDGLRATKRGD